MRRNHRLPLLTLLFVVSILSCKGPNITPDIDSGGETPSPNIEKEDVWDTFTESDIPFSYDLGKETDINYVNEKGESIIKTGFPGCVVLMFDKSVSVKGAWEAIISQGGIVRGQDTSMGLYQVKVEVGKESSFVQAARRMKGCIFTSLEFSIADNDTYVVDAGTHAANVKYHAGDENSIKLIDLSVLETRTFSGLMEKIEEALNNNDCDIVNVSQGPVYGTEKARAHIENEKDEEKKRQLDAELYYGKDHESDIDYKESFTLFLNLLGETIARNDNIKAPVVVSAGNEHMHNFETIFADENRLNKEIKEILGTRLFIVCAEQRDSKGNYYDYSNTVSGDKIKGIVTVNIDGITDYTGTELIAGTSFAAPRFVRYVNYLVKATESEPSPLSFQQAAVLLSQRYLSSKISALDGMELYNVLTGLVNVDFEISGVPEYVSPLGETVSFYLAPDSQNNNVDDDSIQWVISSDSDWIHFYPDTGQGSCKVTMTVDPSMSNEPRTADIQINVPYSKQQAPKATFSITQRGLIVIPAEKDMYYALPGIHKCAGEYDDRWECVNSCITFKTSFEVTECALDDNSVDYEIVPYYGRYVDEDGLYVNNVFVYFNSPLAVSNNCGRYRNADGVRPQEPIPTRKVNLYVLLPGEGAERKGIQIASITQIGMPSICMKEYMLTGVKIPYDVSMDGKFLLNYEVSYPDELSRSICTGLGFIWSAKERYLAENDAEGYYFVGDNSIMTLPIDKSTVEIDFSQFPLKSRTFCWDVDMYIKTVDDYIYAAFPSTISQAF